MEHSGSSRRPPLSPFPAIQFLKHSFCTAPIHFSDAYMGEIPERYPQHVCLSLCVAPWIFQLGSQNFLYIDMAADCNVVRVYSIDELWDSSVPFSLLADAASPLCILHLFSQNPEEWLGWSAAAETWKGSVGYSPFHQIQRSLYLCFAQVRQRSLCLCFAQVRHSRHYAYARLL